MNITETRKNAEKSRRPWKEAILAIANNERMIY